MQFRTGLLAIAALAVSVPATIAVADPIEDAIQARQGYFKLIRANAGPLFGMAKGDMDYNAEQASAFAANLKALTSMDNTALWPAGSHKAANPGKTRALEIAWTTFPAIMEKHNALSAAATDLAASAGGGLDALRSKVGALGAACKGCHDTYRAKDF